MPKESTPKPFVAPPPPELFDHMQLCTLYFFILHTASIEEREVIVQGVTYKVPAHSVTFSSRDLAQRWGIPRRTLSHLLKKLTVPPYLLICATSCPPMTTVTLNVLGRRETPKKQFAPPLAHPPVSNAPPTRVNLTAQSDALNHKVSTFIATYVASFQKHYGAQTRPDLRGKVQGQIKTLLRDVSLDRACALIQIYHQMKNPWFKKKGHDFSTFMENLNKIGIALDTGEENVNGKLDWSWMDNEPKSLSEGNS